MNATELNNPVSEAMAEALGGILTLSFYIIIIRIVIVIGIAALITWVVKKYGMPEMEARKRKVIDTIIKMRTGYPEQRGKKILSSII